RRTYQALHDDLTGLPNRAYLEERFADALADARRHSGRVGVLIIDLAGFKDVNDTLGHHMGDDVLRQVCGRMKDELPPGAVLARFGGDEFVVLVPHVANEDAAVELAMTLLEGLSAPFRLQGFTMAVSARAGVAIYPEHGDDSQSLIQHADVAMYKA